MVTEISGLSASMQTWAKTRALAELLKVRLSALVAFSCAFGYSLAVRGDIHWQTLSMIFVGGFLMSGAAVTVNQIIEKDLDKVMTRTMNRPLPTGRVTIQEAVLFSIGCLVISCVVLWMYANPLTVILSLISLVLYSFVYTPLKRVGPIAVFVVSFD